MTTKVTVFNHGPQSVTVKRVSIDTDGVPYVLKTPDAYLTIEVEPGTSNDVYVHTYERIEVSEVK